MSAIQARSVLQILMARLARHCGLAISNSAALTGETWFDNAAEHRLWRRDEVHNVEVNVVRGQWCYGQDSPWDLGWSMGVRYFRFQESWRFGSLAGPEH